ncbi:MAG: glycosyltransferase family 2 protein, partial [Candidatus Aminicenantes bacterium]|nr:glycosyltransferase family 2 protein [Candidatus Aminicenantes bacterium]
MRPGPHSGRRPERGRRGRRGRHFLRGRGPLPPERAARLRPGLERNRRPLRPRRQRRAPRACPELRAPGRTDDVRQPGLCPPHPAQPRLLDGQDACLPGRNPGAEGQRPRIPLPDPGFRRRLRPGRLPARPEPPRLRRRLPTPAVPEGGKAVTAPARPALPPDVLARTVVIIPAYNEAGNIEAIVAGLRSDFPEARVAVVDDGSTDRTREAAARAGAVVLSHPSNMGYGVALQTGYKYAVRIPGREYVVQIDGDGQHDYREIPKLLGPLVRNEADIVIGSRFFGRRPAYPIGLRRKWGIFFFRLLYRALSKNRINDVTSGMKGLRASVVE